MTVIILCLLGLLLVGGLEARPSWRLPSPPSPPNPSPPTPTSHPSPLPPSPRDVTSQVLWATFARDCKDLDGISTRRGAPRTVVGPPTDRQMAAVAKGSCGPAPLITWYSSTPRSCFLEAYFGTRSNSNRVVVRDVTNLTLLVLNKGSVRPIIDGIDIIVLEPAPPPPPPSPPLLPPVYPPLAAPPPAVPGTSSKHRGVTRSAAVTSSADATPVAAPNPSPNASTPTRDTDPPVIPTRAAMLPIFRVAGASVEELRLKCPDFNRFRLEVRRGVVAPPWYSTAEVLGVRVTMKGPGVDLADVTTVGIAAVGLELMPGVKR